MVCSLDAHLDEAMQEAGGDLAVQLSAQEAAGGGRSPSSELYNTTLPAQMEAVGTHRAMRLTEVYRESRLTQI